VAAAILGTTGCATQVSSGPGLMSNPNDNEWAWSTDAEVGETLTDGLEVLKLNGHRKAVIDSVKLVNAPGLRLVGAQLAGADRSIGAIQYLVTWPPQRSPYFDGVKLRPAEGATILPESRYPRGYELLLGIKVTEPGFLQREGVAITYHIGEDQYREVRHGWLGVCTSPTFHKHGTCPAPPGFQDS
jgi:hypothetical protein